MNLEVDPSSAFLGRALENLSNVIADQSRVLLEEAGVFIPVKSCSTLTAIASLGEASTSDIARQVNTSHQLIKQKLLTLEKRAVLKVKEDPFDKRKRLFSLTAKGREQYHRLTEVLPIIEQLYQNLFDELGVNVITLCAELEARLKAWPLAERARGQS